MANYLELNANYSIYTKNSTIVGRKLKILGTLVYSEARKLPSNLMILLHNENFIVNDGDTQTVLENTIFYMCIDPSNLETVILFDAILDMTRVTRLNFEHFFDAKITINQTDSNANLINIVNFIQDAVRVEYNGDVSIVLTQQEATNNSQTLLVQTENALIRSVESLDALNKLLPATKELHDQITANNTTNQVNEINTVVNNIAETVNIIASKV